MNIFKYLILSLIVMVVCSCTVSVPKSKIPVDAWQPGDIGRVKRIIYVERYREIVSLSKTNRDELVGVLNPGDLIRIISCINYPHSTTGGTHLEMEAISGGMKSVKFTDGIIFDSVVDSEGETFAAPDPKIIERVVNMR